MNRTFPLFARYHSASRRFAARISRRADQSLFPGLLRALSLLGGSLPFFQRRRKRHRRFYPQIALYFVSLFALLAGVSSAQAEREEWQLMFAQPVPRAAYVIGKFLPTLSIFAARACCCFSCRAFSPAPLRQRIAPLYLQTLLLAAAFLALGLAAGFFAHDRAQALIVGVSAWLLLLFGLDLIALFAARWSSIQKFPDLWVALLMLNPLDSFRIEALFALEQIPAEAANKTPLAGWWIAHAGVWFSVIAAFWSSDARRAGRSPFESLGGMKPMALANSKHWMSVRSSREASSHFRKFARGRCART